MKQFKHFLNERRFEADNIISVLKHSFYIKDGKSVDLTTSEDFIAYLKENYNIKEIGAGAFSIAVISGNTNNPKYILKYNHEDDGGDGWFYYADKILKEKPKTSLIPKILYAGFPLINDEEIGIGIMEYLTIDTNEVDDIKDQITTSFLLIIKKYKELLENTIGYNNIIGMFNDEDHDSNYDLGTIILLHLIYIKDITELQILYKHLINKISKILHITYSDFENYIQFLGKHFSDFKWFDTHSENIGFRGDSSSGQMVIFDI